MKKLVNQHFSHWSCKSRSI